MGPPRTTIENPILNSPYDAPTRCFKFDSDGITDEILDERRRSEFFVAVPAPKKKSGKQQEIDFLDVSTERVEPNELINGIRSHVDRWREFGYPGITPTTRALLAHWHDAERERRLFFCQLEAIETAIYLTEAAAKSNGVWIENAVRKANDEANPGLYRVAHKMATGTGKTVIMAMLIAWHTLNKVANPQDRRFGDAFLVVCPGITIRDRLRVLLPSDPTNYYREMDLVPADRLADLGTAKVVITNFHAFKPKEKLSAPKTTKQVLLPNGDTAGVFTETPDQMVRRVLRDLGTKRQVVVLNDEAHHCYRRRPAEIVTEAASDELDALKGEEKTEAKKRDEEARVWLSGLEAIQHKVGIRAIHDLSATPFFLKGSGWPEGTLFPWVVSDFGLIDAIEAGLVKIPRVPVDDDAASKDLPTFRNLWFHIRDELPKRGRKNTDDANSEPKLPAALQGALHSLYGNYEAAFARWRAHHDLDGTETSTPPVFIVVCNNTTVSKLVYDYVAGWEKPQPNGDPVVVPGALPLFSNEHGGGWRDRAYSILIDSTQLEGEGSMSDAFKQIASREIAEFKAEYAQRFPGRDADQLTDEDLLREVMNTVGKAGKLGEAIRCVVSVSMLTEGWDANTVTHILGVRAFGTQLLCEQVVGRGLRRRSYVVDDDTGHFLPEYAEIYGIPFSFIPAAGQAKDPEPPKPVHRVRALPERARAEITFPHVVGYRYEIPDDRLDAQFGPDSCLVLSAEDVPTKTEVSGVGGEIEIHTLDDLRRVRPQQIAFTIAKELLDKYFTTLDAEAGERQERPWLFPALVRIVSRWMDDPACLVLKDNAFPQLLWFQTRMAEATEKIYRGIVTADGGESRLQPILRGFEPIGSTRYVDFDTTKPVYETDPDKCHVNLVAGDSNWEHRMAQALEEIDEVKSYVKNQGLGFTVPYTFEGRSRAYVPDFIARADDGHGEDLLNLVIEVTGERRKDKVEKVATMRDLWVPAVNAHGGFGRWAVVEVTDPWDAHATIRSVLAGASV